MYKVGCGVFRQGGMPPIFFGAESCMRLRMAVVTAFVGMAVGLGTADKKQAQSAAPANAVSVPAAEEEPAAVHIDGRTIIEIKTAIGGYTAEERAARVQERLQAVAQNTSVPVSSIQSVDEESWSQVKANDFVILWVTEPDAIAAGQDRRKLAAQHAAIFRQPITNYRSRHTWKRFFRSLGMTAIATAVLLLLWYLVVVVHRWMRSRLEDWIARAEERLRQETKIRLRATY